MRKTRAAKVVKMVQELRLIMPKVGTRKLYYILEERLRELKVGRDMLFKILKANHMLIKPKRHYHITTNSHHRFRKHKNLIDNVVPTRPEQIWVSDITYVGTRKNPMYLALVTDAYSKKIVGFDVSNSLAIESAAKAFKNAIKRRDYKETSLIHHSDRGFQYCSDQYQYILNKSKITCSMTESYDPYANAVAERVNGILKAEFIGYNKNVKIKIMRELIKNSIMIYNGIRPHYSAYYKTPNQMHKQSKIKIRTYRKQKTSNHVIAGLY